jgi:hypothetical protein
MPDGIATLVVASSSVESLRHPELAKDRGPHPLTVILYDVRDAALIWLNA